MRVRKNAIHLTSTERDNFLRAVLTLKNTIANPGDPLAQQISVYDQFVALHLYTLSINVPAGGVPINMGHKNSGFGPWHRFYLLRFEQALQAVDPTVMLPYWDWTDHAGTQGVLFQDNYLGPNGGGGGGGDILSGYFAFNAPGSGGNLTPLPPWWPAGLAGWRIRPSLAQGHPTTLQRFMQAFGNLAVQGDIQTTLGKSDYEIGTPFRPALEGGARMHNFTHGWVGGQMGDPNASPNDLIFFLHHCGIDRIWAMWQIDSHQGAAFYPAAGRPEGHNLNDAMWPWVGGIAGYSSNNAQGDVVLPNFTAEPIQHPADMLNHRALGYCYDTEPVVGLALDQTGSMTGITPDPMTGMPPNISKWDAAKQGVSFFLHDCESAYTAKEAYVTAGVETFRSLGVNTFTPIFPGTPYGVIKNGGTYSQATFDANIAAQAPGGGTPLAGALTDTDTNLVRAPYGNLPANEQRYLLILTDGIETAPPPLTSLAEPQFPDTAIFAMGFGVGGGWDGVDYATIATLVAKGKTLPTVPTQVFHGENAGTIDKFYTNSVAAAIGYTPSVDPIFELYPGEHVHLGFDVTDADSSLMITALGFDFSDKNWDFCLMCPDGSHCCDTREHGGEAGHTHAHTHTHGLGERCPFLITMKKRSGRCTIFVNRNGAESHDWVGRWFMMAFYQADADDPMMEMPAIADLILPNGAPPVRGPLYARFNQPASQRPAVRAIPRAAATSLVSGLAGIAVEPAGDPCAVSINIYHKTTINARLAPFAKAPFAGNDFELELSIDVPSVAKFAPLFVTARLVAPLYSIGNLFADLDTIPVAARRKYLQPNNPAAPFDEIKYLADYERKKPGAFPVRDELVTFVRAADGHYRATVSKTAFPGVYRVGAYLEGTVDFGAATIDECCPPRGPQRFTRVLHAEAAMGILPDAGKSRPVAHWLGPDKLVVTVTPADRLGNIADPARATPLEISINGMPVKGERVNPFTGEQQVHIAIEGRGFKINEDGQNIAEGVGSIATIGGEKLTLERGKEIAITVRISSTSLPVILPRFVGNKTKKQAFAAGSSQAMKIALTDRLPFADKDQVVAGGFKLA